MKLRVATIENLSWNPTRVGGPSFKTHQIKLELANRIEYKATIVTKIFVSVFFILGISLIANGLQYDIKLFIFGVFFLIVSLILIYNFFRPIIFDKKLAFYWKVYKHYFNRTNFINLDDIKAIQIISDYRETTNNSYNSYEINLVLKDSNRINVIDHSDYDSSKEDAYCLSIF